MKNQLLLIAEDAPRSRADAARRALRSSAGADGTKSSPTPTSRRRVERSHERAEVARAALREASERATRREAARRHAREQALLAAANQPRLPVGDALPPRPRRAA
ncbi:MAG: hypothetical protein GY812_01405 [Actinomycetia bacterium]|nr:hypothetical protein [Actinomycetes bacterium]